jgi:PAS domain S-box-containing protein
MNPRLILAILLPFAACGLQWLLWDAWIEPYVWFLFFPAAFFSAWLGGLRGGLAGTVIGALLVWFVYMPPAFSFELHEPAGAASIVLFVVMGGLFAWFFERLTLAMRTTDEALQATEAASAKISRLYEKTLELDKLKSQFFANVSHELRTPLTLILAPLEQRLRRLATAPAGGGGGPRSVREASASGVHAAVDEGGMTDCRAVGAGDSESERRETELMLRNARLLYRHVSDLLDAAKLEAGRMTIGWSRVDLSGLVRAVASHFESLARERGIAYTVKAPEALPAEADGEKLQRVLLNLLSNAFKFTPDGGRIELRLARENRHVLIEVQDNGPGVPADMREAVFERFRQVEGDARRLYGGTSLGLAIVREFAELHGGSANVAEAPGGGALFLVRLPLRAPAGSVIQEAPGTFDPIFGLGAVGELCRPARDAAAPTRTEDGANKPLVLVVEDNADMNAFIADALRPHYRVACAFDGREGIEMALALHPDLILSDIMMPAMSGDRMVAELRRQPGTADVPIVMLTAKADDDLRVRLLKEGVQDYLHKPFSVEELLARIGGLLETRRRSAFALRASEERYRTVVNSLSEGVMLFDLAGEVLTANPAAERILGLGVAEMQSRGLGDWRPIREDGSPFPLGELPVAQVLAACRPRRGIVLGDVNPKGNVAWLTINAEPVLDPANGELAAVVVSFADITDRKQAEDRLVKSQAQLKAFIRHAPVSIAMFDRDMNYLATSGRWVAEYGRGYADLVGLNHYQVHPDMPPEWKRVHRQGLAGETLKNDEDLWTQADGSRHWLRWAVLPWTDENGAIGGIIICAEDITERMLAREEILRLNADLERRVAERTAELTAANRELDSFAYAVSHDLRAPLRAMSGFGQALVEDYGDRLAGEAKSYIDQIVIASRRMGELIDGLLALSRSTRGELRRDAVDLSALARRLLDELAQGDPAREVAAEVEAGLAARGDAHMIEVAMRNLLGNAWKYTAQAVSPSIRVYANVCEGRHWICVADNGAGFDMAHAGKLFQPFQRLHRQDEFPGIGIGLATVQRIVHRHGGVIEARGEPGKGAVFCSPLPDVSLSSLRNEEEARR